MKLIKKKTVCRSGIIQAAHQVPNYDTGLAHLRSHGVARQVAVLGSARATPDHRKLGWHFKQAREFGRMARQWKDCAHLITGGGPGIMMAANGGAADELLPSGGICSDFPGEEPNPYSCTNLRIKLTKLDVRQSLLLVPASAAVCFAGGLGTTYELMQAATYLQTGKSKNVKLILVGKDFWERVLEAFDVLIEYGTIDIDTMDMFTIVSNAEEAAGLVDAQLTEIQTSDIAA